MNSFKFYIENYRIMYRLPHSINPKFLSKEVLDNPPGEYLLFEKNLSYKRGETFVFVHFLDDPSYSYSINNDYCLINVLNWEVIDLVSDSNITVFIGILNRLESIKGEKLKNSIKLKYKDIKDIPDYVYHGTDLCTYEKSIKKTGLVGQVDDPLKRNFLTYYARSSGVYVSDNYEKASMFAQIKAKKNECSEAVVLKLDIRNYKDHLMADEDYSKDKNLFLKSLNNIGTAYISTRIYPKFIEVEDIIKVKIGKRKIEKVDVGLISDLFNFFKNEIDNRSDKLRFLYIFYGNLMISGYQSYYSIISDHHIDNFLNEMIRKVRNMNEKKYNSFKVGVKRRINSEKYLKDRSSSLAIKVKNIDKDLKEKFLEIIDKY